METYTQEIYNPRFIIAGHFSLIKNKIQTQIDKFKLKLLEPSEQKLNELKRVRDRQIAKIEEIEQVNSFEWTFGEHFKDKWSNLINDDSIEYVKKLDQMKEFDLIKSDCILVEDFNIETKSLYIYI